MGGLGQVIHDSGCKNIKKNHNFIPKISYQSHQKLIRNSKLQNCRFLLLYILAKMRLGFLCMLYLQFSACFQPSRFQPSKNTTRMEETNLKDTECFVDCFHSCGHAWSYCSRVAIFLGPIIEYTGIYLEEEEYGDRQKILSFSGALEGIAAAAAQICRGKQDRQDSQCHKVW